MLNRPADRIVYFYTELNEEIKKISKMDLVEVVKFFNQDIIDDWTAESGHMVIFVDDHLNENIYDRLADVYAVKSRSKFISIVLITQNQFTKSGNAARWNRTILLNSTLSILFCNKRDQSLVSQVGRTAFQGRFRFFMDSYKTICDSDQGGHKYLAIFSDPSTPKFCELRTKIFFKTEVTILFWPRK